jgi:hypothetical protein
MNLIDIGGVVWTGFIWLRIGTSGGFRETLRNSWVAEPLAAFREGLSSMEIDITITSKVLPFVRSSICMFG